MQETNPLTEGQIRQLEKLRNMADTKTIQVLGDLVIAVKSECEKVDKRMDTQACMTMIASLMLRRAGELMRAGTDITLAPGVRPPEETIIDNYKQIAIRKYGPANVRNI